MLRPICCLVPLVLLAGCTTVDIAEPEPTASAPAVVTPSGSASACAVSSVTVARPGESEQAFVYAVRLEREPGSSLSTQLVAAPFTPTLIWQTSPAPTDAEVLAAIGDLENAPTVDPRDSTDAVNQFLHDADIDTGDVVGYSSIVAVQQGVRVSCQGGAEAHGTLTTSTQPEIGMVSCDQAPPTTSSTAARLAYARYCA